MVFQRFARRNLQPLPFRPLTFQRLETLGLKLGHR